MTLKKKRSNRLMLWKSNHFYTFLFFSTCKIIETKDPAGCEQTDSTDAQPREQPRLPRSPRHLHPASRRRRSPALWSEHAPAAFAPHTGPRFQTGRLPPPTHAIYRLGFILA